MCSTLDRYRSFAPLVLRIVLGGLFVWHGIDKFDTGIAMIEGMFRMWGVPAPALAAPVIAVLEIVGGLALILGLATRMMAMVLGLLLLGALYYVKQDLGIISSQPMPGAELDLAILAGLAALFFTGPGRWSVDGSIGIEREDASPVPGAAASVAG